MENVLILPVVHSLFIIMSMNIVKEIAEIDVLKINIVM
jgi:hypothetical protein